VFSKRLPLLQELVFDAVLYVITLIYVSGLSWGTGELLWALWISSFSLGYCYIVLSCIGIPSAMIRGVIKTEDPQLRRKGLPLIPLAFLSAAFLLGFFTIHFGMFHLVHGFILESLFPLPDGIVAQGHDPLEMLFVVPALLLAFWPFIVLCLITQYQDFLDLSGENKKLNFAAPYTNVIRMHLTIMAIGFASAAGIDEFGLYFVLMIYFLPLLSIGRSILQSLGLIKAKDVQNKNTS